MPYLSVKTRRILLVLLLLTFCKISSAQNAFTDLTFRIDSLAEVGRPKSALAEVVKLDRLAHKNNDPAYIIKAAIYRVTFQSYLEEDAWKPIVESLKTDISNAKFPVKPVLQSLLAEIYWKYYEEKRYEISGRTRLESPDEDFTKWDIQTIITEANHLFKLSLADAALAQQTPVSILDGVLVGDSTTRNIRPTLYDLLAHRAIDHFFKDEADVVNVRDMFAIDDPLLFSDDKTFAALVLKQNDTASNYYQGLSYLQQATQFHLKNNKDVLPLTYLGLERLAFLKDKYTGNKKDSLYKHGLIQISSNTAAGYARGSAFLKLAEFEAGRDSLVSEIYYLNEVIRAFPKSGMAVDASAARRRVTSKEINGSVEDNNMPGKSILALLEYRNLRSVQAEVYLITAAVKKILDTKKLWDEGGGLSARDEVLAVFKKLKPMRSQQLELPGTADFRKHRAEFNIATLPIGNYVLLIKDSTKKINDLTGLSNFRVTRLSYVSRKRPDGMMEIKVLDRSSGFPISGVKVTIFKWQENYKYDYARDRQILYSGISDRDGTYLVKHVTDDQYSVSLSFGNDRYIDANDHDDAGYVYNDKSVPAQVKTVMFTDRQIYRPGQTIYFKGLQIQTVDGKSSIVPNADVKFFLRDGNVRSVDSLKLRTNEFGSAAGSLIIPANILPGRLILFTSNGGVMLQVEEYKRPTFGVEFLPSKMAYHPGDPVHLKGKVTAFAGYGLSNAKVKYTINRQLRPIYTYYRSYGSRKANRDDGDDDDENAASDLVRSELVNDTLTTNGQGEFEISFKAATRTKPSPSGIYDFSVDVDVTDASGETRSANTNVPVSMQALTLVADVPENLQADDKVKIPLKLTNLYDQPQAGQATIQVYSLKQANQTFKDRKWGNPDKFLMSEEEFKRSFPSYAYKKEDDFEYWKSLGVVSNEDIQLNDTSSYAVNLDVLKKQSPGVYKIIITAKSIGGDTISTTRYVNLMGETAKAQNISNWVLPVLTSVVSGQKAVFWVGTGRKEHILLEKYDGPKLLSAEWLDLDGTDQRKIEIDVPATAKNSFAVQFLMVNDNRYYHSYQQLTLKDPVPPLNVRFLTFRDKLAPGDREQWKIQVTTAEKGLPNAELLAGMYDASLDAIANPGVWDQQLKEGFYHPDYFAWSDGDFVNENEISNQTPIDGDGLYIFFKGKVYEQLDMLGFGTRQPVPHYYGYSGSERYSSINRRTDRSIKAKYAVNAARIKNGYDIWGRVLSHNRMFVPGVKITVKGTGISTLSNSLGYFRIKVPINAILVFTKRGALMQTLTTKRGGAFIVKLTFPRRKGGPFSEYELDVADPGPKSMKGDKDAEVVVADAISSPPPLVDKVSFPPPVAKADVELKEVGFFNNSGNGYNEFKSPYPGGPLSNPVPVTIRKDFKETAFFYPQLRTNEKGESLIEFTVPDALTKWRFRAFAHTKALQTGYLENTVVTQKQLSISANMPRFFREGDTVTVSARLANLTTGKLNGQVTLQLFNGLNMQPVSVLADKKDAEQSFDIAGSNTQAVSFRLIIPQGLDALTYRLTAASGNFTDGEENTIPVLPNRALVTESMPMMVRAGQSRSFNFDKLINTNSKTLQNKTLTLEYTQNPAWYAVQALPYLMEFPYECSEQTFSRYFANSLASSLVNKMPVIKQVFGQWKAGNSSELLSNLEKNQELKSTLLEETPWLRDAVDETEQKKRIALLFDLSKMDNEMQANIQKLFKMQLPSGGFPWFGGNQADRYISQHILTGIGQLYHLKVAENNNGFLSSIAQRAIKYVDDQLTIDDKEAKKDKYYETREPYATEIHAWYARSYFTDKAMSAPLKAIFNNYSKRVEAHWVTAGIYEQGMIALTLLRNGKADVAKKIISSLKETAQRTDDLGMYWGKNVLGYYWYQSPVETQSLMIELFSEAGGNDKDVEEMKIWLLRNKQTHDWKTTKATAQACYALLLKNDTWLDGSATSVIKLNGKPLEELKPDIKAEAGTGYIKTNWADEQVKPALGKVGITNNGKSISWGAMHWQYLEQLDKISPSNTGIQLERKYFIQKQTASGPILTAVDATHQPKTGDLLKVVVYLKAGRDFEYVQLKDMRPSGTEPADVLSEYKFQDGLYYYQVTKDVATNFFISNLSKGSYVFEYRLRVAQPGKFSTGITSVQSMYAPEFNAHSNGTRVEFVK